MKAKRLFLIVIAVLMLSISVGYAQFKITVSSGRVLLNNDLGRPDEKQIAPLADSLDRNIKANPADTTSLFLRAVIYLKLNDILAKPYQDTKGAAENLVL